MFLLCDLYNEEGLRYMSVNAATLQQVSYIKYVTAFLTSESDYNFVFLKNRV